MKKTTYKNELARVIKAFIQYRAMVSQSEIAKRSGYSRIHLNRVINGNLPNSLNERFMLQVLSKGLKFEEAEARQLSYIFRLKALARVLPTGKIKKTLEEEGITT